MKPVNERKMHVLHVLAEHNHIMLCPEPRWWNFPPWSVILSRATRICPTVYANRRAGDLSESEKDLWHNRSTGYLLVVSVWSCVCVSQYVDILDQFPLTVVSVTLSLMFHHQGCEGWFLIWLLTAQFSYQAIAFPESLCLDLRPQAEHQTWRFKWLRNGLLSIYTDGLCLGCVLLMSICRFVNR